MTESHFKAELAAALGDPFDGRTDWTAQELADKLNALAREYISPAELADALRESSQMSKAGLLNRTRGLVKAATRKGNWP